MNRTLLIMAAGMGSRFGGAKQVAQMGPHGEILLEYSIHDALKAGFDKVVFVIKRAMAEDFRAMIGDKIARKCDVRYVFQEFDSLPGGFVPPEGRVKPYGTVHAVLSAREEIREPFAVINADDYYGPEAFAEMAKCLERMAGREKACAMVAYRLRNTLSENGHVTRGICTCNQQGSLERITETYKVQAFPDGTVRDLENDPAGRILDPDAPVSMNFWGLTPWYFAAADKALSAFLREENGDPMKKEFALPTLIDRFMHEDDLRVEVLSTDAAWFGVTYKEDREPVAQALRRLHEQGVYPEEL